MVKRFMVSPSEGGQGDWKVKEEGGRELESARDRDEAIRKGEEIARRERGVLSIQNEDGRIEDTRSFSEEGGGGGQGGGGRER
jgi:hypothetical protein